MTKSLRPAPVPSAPSTPKQPLCGSNVFLICVGALLVVGHLSPGLVDRAWALLLLVPLAFAVRRTVQAWYTVGRVSKGQVVWVLIAATIAVTGVQRLTGMTLDVPDGWVIPVGLLGMWAVTVLRRP